METPVIVVDLDLPPRERWAGLRSYRHQIRQLVGIYMADLGGLEPLADVVRAHRDAFVGAEHLEEMSFVAELADLDPLSVFLVNGYYDAFKQLMGCTAFGVDTASGPIHARNLDWWTEHDALARSTIVARFVRGGAVVFETVTWPGFVGALSGVAHGRFAVTLNAAISDEPATPSLPVALRLRELLARASYDEALHELTTATMGVDCLLLLTGARAGELAVIERTSTRSAVRHPEDGVVVVANEYKALLAPGWEGSATDVLQETSSRRYARANARARSERPDSTGACFDILDDAEVKMAITMQQMVMSAARGFVEARPGRT